MSAFYGTVEGMARTVATRRGSKGSGITTYAAGWRGAVRVDVFEEDGHDCYRVSLVPWESSGGSSRVLAEGVLEATQEAPRLPGCEHHPACGAA